MKNGGVSSVTYGPWLVGLGAALWGTESAWRIPLNNLFDADVIVFWEHVLILLMFLPLLVSRVGEIRKIDARTWGYLILSGFAGSVRGKHGPGAAAAGLRNGLRRCRDGIGGPDDSPGPGGEAELP